MILHANFVPEVMNIVDAWNQDYTKPQVLFLQTCYQQYPNDSQLLTSEKNLSMIERARR